MCLDGVRSKALEDALDDIFRRAVRGVDGKVRLAVPGQALVPAFREACAIGENRTDGTALMGGAAGDHGLEGRFEKDDEGVAKSREEVAGCALFERTASESQDEVVIGAGGERFADDVGFEIAESGLTATGEDIGNGHGGAGFDQHVGIEEVPAKPLGEQSADRGFARTHETGEDHPRRVGRRQIRRWLRPAHALLII